MKVQRPAHVRFRIRIGFLSLLLAMGVFHAVLMLHGVRDLHPRCVLRGMEGLIFACVLAAAVVTVTE